MEVIDAYSHVLPTAAYEQFSVGHDASPPPHLDDEVMTEEGIPGRIAMLDEYDITKQVISLTLPRSGGPWNRDHLLEVTRTANDEIRAIADEHPDRFIPIGTVPFLDGEYIDETRRCLDTLGMAGMQIESNVNGHMIDSPEFIDFFEVVNDADVPVWIHPTTTDWHDYTDQEQWLYKMIGWPFDTSIAVMRLIFNGVFDEFENLKVVAHHLGGVLPMLDERIHTWTERRVKNIDRFDEGALPRYDGELEDYLSRVYGDTALFSRGKTQALACGYEFFGPDNVVFAFDYPYARERQLEQTLSAFDRFQISDEDKRKIFAENAREQLGLG